MKRLTTILITIILLATSIQSFIVVGHFYLNRVQLTEKYCINKSNLDLNCKASCYLKKQLDSQDKQDPKNTIEQTKWELSQFIPNENQRIICSTEIPKTTKTLFRIDISHKSDYHAECFRPPKSIFYKHS